MLATLNRIQKIADEALLIARRALGAAGGVVTNAFVQGGNSFGALAVLGTKDANNLEVITNNVSRAVFDQSGNFVPPADNSGQVGTNAARWALLRGVTVTSGDLHLVDEEGESHWVMREAAGAPVLYDMKTKKLYRIPLEEISTKGFRLPRQDIHHSSDIRKLLATIEKMTGDEARAELATLAATMEGAAEAGPAHVASDAEDHLEAILRQIQEVQGQHQDMGLGDHPALRSVHDDVVRHYEVVRAHAERHEAAENPPEPPDEAPTEEHTPPEGDDQ